jgi:hypothetical protein
MLVMFRVPSPELYKVTSTASLVVPTVRARKGTDNGERLTAGAGGAPVPVPDKAAEWGLPGASSVITREALRAPRAVGVKLTLAVQLAPAAKVAPQVVVREKSPGFVPPIATLAMLIVTPVLFVYVKTSGESMLVFPTFVELKVYDPGRSEAIGPMQG